MGPGVEAGAGGGAGGGRDGAHGAAGGLGGRSAGGEQSESPTINAAVRARRGDYGLWLLSSVQYSTVKYSTAHHRIVQYNRAQHVTGQYSAVQHSAALYSQCLLSPPSDGVLRVQEMMALMDVSFTGMGSEGALYDSGDESVHSAGSGGEGGGRRGGSGHGARPPGEALTLLQGHMLLEPYNVPMLVSGMPVVCPC